ncbi:MAG: FAD:protein FMN transferase [Bacilli bacterium]|nr:FAD:protein FMN transferase [Bacilli bacterium]
MKKKIILIMLFIILGINLIIIAFLNMGGKNLTSYSQDYTYMNTYFNIKIYSNSDASKVEEMFTEIDQILSEYHELSDRYNAYNGINNLYYINNNTDNIEYITLDERLYNMIAYGIKMYDETDGLLNINLGHVIDIWKKYREAGTGVPTLEELKNSGSTDINDIVLTDDNQILNNHPSIDLGSLVKGYVTNIIKDFLEENGFDSYLINAGGHIVLGDTYHDDLYRIAIRKPNDDIVGNIVLKISNTAVSTSGGYERYYEYDGVTYNHIIDPNTLFPSSYMQSVSVVSKDSALADILSTTLFLMPIEDGKNLVESMDGVEAVWYDNDNEVIRSSGFSNYE